MRRIVWFSVACAGAMALVMVIFSATVGFSSLGLSGHGVVAITMGITFSTALAIALMALIFYSSRHDQDGVVHRVAAQPKRRLEP
ncbi:MAG: hypothetical protein IRZ04_15445 [Rhodospirillales bacterium]|nr:hypothetical protein [Rhodospirillales bacterium]